jgi:hypothetical protein
VTFRRSLASEAGATLGAVTTREQLHRDVDALTAPQVPKARIVVIDEVGEQTSVKAILARHGEQRLNPEEFERHFGDLPADGEG